MKLYDNKGKMKFPEPRKSIKENDQIEIIEECFCQNGHNLKSSRIKFNTLNGIYLKVKNDKKEGFIGLSPVCGSKTRVSIDIDLEKDERYNFYCPECDVKLPVFSPCPSCSGNLITIFRNNNADYNYCIGVCNTVDCAHAEIKTGDEMRTIIGERFY